MEESQATSSTPPPPTAAGEAAGLSDNVAGALAYITIIPAILFLILADYNRRPFVKFNSLQCIGLAIIAFCLSVIAIIPILGWIVAIVGDLALLVCWVMCIVKAYQGQRFLVPFIGTFVENMAK